MPWLLLSLYTLVKTFAARGTPGVHICLTVSQLISLCGELTYNGPKQHTYRNCMPTLGKKTSQIIHSGDPQPGTKTGEGRVKKCKTFSFDMSENLIFRITSGLDKDLLCANIGPSLKLWFVWERSLWSYGLEMGFVLCNKYSPHVFCLQILCHLLCKHCARVYFRVRLSISGSLKWMLNDFYIHLRWPLSCKLIVMQKAINLTQHITFPASTDGPLLA